jgi:NPCBM/NEW2 domain
VRASSPAVLVAAFFVLAVAPGADAGGGTAQPVTIAASSAAPYVMAGGGIVIEGAVKPHVSGLALGLQQRRGDGWLTVGSATAHADGAFSFTTHPKTPGLATYRVAARDTSYAGDSAPVPVEVVHWTYLANVYIQMPRGTGELDTEPVKADGITYQYPVALDAGCYNAWNGSAWVNYTLGKRFEELKATVAIADDALQGTTGSYEVIADNKTVQTGNLVPGQSAKLDISVAGVSRLKLLANFPDPTGAGGCSSFYPRMVFGDAQLLGP